jgi:glycosyltransferase involved in cell wall biosynthesis
MNPPLVSVIIPNYNYGTTIGLCVRAAQRQTYQPIEILVVDDCSTDDSAATAAALGARVVSTGVNGGVAVARNLGAAEADGEILVFVDSDVAMHPDAVEHAVAALRADPGLGVVAGLYEPEPLIVNGTVERYRNFHQYYWLEAAAGELHDFVPTAIMAIPAVVYAELGGFLPHLRETEGADFGRRLGAHHRMLLSAAVRGKHDNDPTLRVVLRKVFHRTRLHIPFFLDRSRVAQVATSQQSGGCLAAALAVAAAPAPALLGPAGALIPLVLFAAWYAGERRFFRAALRHRGTGFAAAVVALHYLVNLTTAAGIAVGLAQWAGSARFRRLYTGLAT